MAIATKPPLPSVKILLVSLCSFAYFTHQGSLISFLILTHPMEGRPCIGFTLGRTENHITTVCDPSECLHVPKEAKAARNLLQKLVESSPYAPYCKINQSGFWYDICVYPFPYFGD